MSVLKMPFTAGLPETACGAGSTLKYTAGIRRALPELFKELEIKTLLDAPCGDFNWMAHTDLSAVEYIGLDYDDAHFRSAIVRDSQPVEYRPRSKAVIVRDITWERLPKADMMICRDFLQHIPNDRVLKFFYNFFLSAIPWLLVTSHSNSVNEDIPRVGMFRPLNLMSQPFGLAAPYKTISDGEGRILGLWHRDHM